jgi:type IV pilus assembly protein PilW
VLIAARSRQAGVTIIELLVGMAVGALVVGGAITMYAATVRSSSETLRSSKLNQEIGALMSVIVNDVRRAGFWEGASGGDYHLNPFAQPGTTALAVFDTMAGSDQGALGQGSCLVYAYDATYLPGNTPGVVDATDIFGFRLNGSVVQMRQTGGTANSCTDGTWANVTDPNLVAVTGLSFDLGGSLCLNGSEPNGEDDDSDGTIDNAEEVDCYATVPAVGSDEPTSETRAVVITINAELANDPTTQMTATHSVRVRNDYLRLR